jgi:IPT/TIG domain-containing protein
MKTVSSQFKVSALVVVMAGALVGCEGGSYDAATGRITFPNGRSESAERAASSAAPARSDGASASTSQDSAASALQGSATESAGVAPSAAASPSDAPPVDASAFNRAPPTPAANPNGGPPVKPDIANVSPASGPAEGGGEVVITGSGFANVQVMWGGDVARVTSQSSNAITVVVPAGTAGAVTTLVVTNRDGTYGVRPAAYTYR